MRICTISSSSERAQFEESVQSRKMDPVVAYQWSSGALTKTVTQSPDVTVTNITTVDAAVARSPAPIGLFRSTLCPVERRWHESSFIYGRPISPLERAYLSSFLFKSASCMEIHAWCMPLLSSSPYAPHRTPYAQTSAHNSRLR